MLQGEKSRGGRDRLWFVLVRIPELIMALIVAVLVVFLTLAVVGRYVFDIGITWSDELARMLFVWVVFLGFAVAIRHRGNIGVELFVDRLSRPARRMVFLFQDIAVLAFSLFFTWEAAITVRFSLLQRLPVLQITIAWLYAAVLVAGVMMTVYAAANLRDTLRGKTAHADAAGEDALRHIE
jgi:TRAP-type C4-dicarboxylate transport system permease small subunit